MTNLLSQLREQSIIVADTGDFESIRKFQPRDATTNPSLLLKAAQMPEYKGIVDKVLDDSKQQNLSSDARIPWIMDRLAVSFGVEILKIVPNRVSTEVDARLSFDTEASVAKGKALIDLYKGRGIDRERILIKLASTWEGIQAAALLKKEGINSNLTLLFSFPQAVACAQVGVQLISPFVGRILDWYKKAQNKDNYPSAEDPGVVSVTQIYNYYKQHGHKTEIMGASFRNVGEILELAGCDLLTISPALLDELAKTPGSVPRKLSPETANRAPQAKVTFDEKSFRWALNENQMATEKLSDGIRLFAADTGKLEKWIAEKIDKA